MDYSNRANNILQCVGNFNVLISICVSSKLSSCTLGLSKY